MPKQLNAWFTSTNHVEQPSSSALDQSSTSQDIISEPVGDQSTPVCDQLIEQNPEISPFILETTPVISSDTFLTIADLHSTDSSSQPLGVDEPSEPLFSHDSDSSVNAEFQPLPNSDLSQAASLVLQRKFSKKP